jgi:hypothetical protein
MTDQYSDHFDKAYAEYNKVLRTWFVAFGVGVPGALLLSPDTKGIVAGAESGSLALVFLLAGSGLQILSALLNKYVAWCNDLILYRKHFPGDDPKPNPKSVERLASLTEVIWIDVSIDVVTSILYLWSLFLLYDLLI